MVVTEIEPEIQRLVEARDFTALRNIFKEWSPADLADLLTDLPADEQVLVFRILPHDVAAVTFEYLGFGMQQSLLHAMGDEETCTLVNQMSPDDRTALLEELPSAAVTQLLTLLSPEKKAVAPVASRLSGAQCRTFDDAGLHRRARRVDGEGDVRFHPHSRPRQRDA